MPSPRRAHQRNSSPIERILQALLHTPLLGWREFRQQGDIIGTKQLIIDKANLTTNKSLSCQLHRVGVVQSGRHDSMIQEPDSPYVQLLQESV